MKDWLGPYLDDEVAADARRAVDAHLAGCAACSAELDSLRSIANAVSQPTQVTVPPTLWNAIERRLNEAGPRRRLVLPRFVRAFAAAAAVVLAVGVGLFSIPWGASTAQAATVNFGTLLDGVRFNPAQALSAFLSEHQAREVSPERAKRHGRELNFALPETLPGGFRLDSTYALRFGRYPGVAARYDRNGEMLAVIFHRPVLQEEFGTHEDRECVVGLHRGHAVEVGEWSLVHVTDPTTCHCILSKLDMKTELPAIMEAIAPDMPETRPAERQGSPEHP